MKKQKLRRAKVKEVVAERIRYLETRFGRVTPEIVVQDALRRDSPLHKCGGFQWDLKKAAYEHWLDRARVLIASVEVVVHIDHRAVSTVCYVRDPRLRREQGYVSIEDLRADRTLSIHAINDQLKMALALLDRVKRLAAALGLGGRVQRAINQLQNVAVAVHRLPRRRGHAPSRGRSAARRSMAKSRQATAFSA